jgi:hypothetical protein
LRDCGVLEKLIKFRRLVTHSSVSKLVGDCFVVSLETFHFHCYRMETLEMKDFDLRQGMGFRNE